MPPPRKVSAKTLILALLFGISFSACQKEEGVKPASLSTNSGARIEASKKIKLDGEYLDFPTPAAFDEFMKVLPLKNSQDLDVWEQSLGFRSMRHYHETAIKENVKYHEYLRKNMTIELAKQIHNNKGLSPRSEFVKANSEMFLFDEYGNPKLNLYDPTLAAVLNKDGIVKIGRYLFQYTEDYLKVMPANKKDQIQSFKKADKDSPENQITVKKIIKTLSQKINKGGRTEAYDFSACSDGSYEFYKQGDLSWLPFIGFYYPLLYRRVDGCVSLYTTYAPIYETNPDGIESPVENPPQIIGWNVFQTLTANAAQQERSEIRFPLNNILEYNEISWQGQAIPENGLSISVNTYPILYGAANQSGIANVNYSKSAQVLSAYSITGQVSFSGDGGLPFPISIQ